MTAEDAFWLVLLVAFLSTKPAHRVARSTPRRARRPSENETSARSLIGSATYFQVMHDSFSCLYTVRNDQFSMLESTFRTAFLIHD